MTTIKRSALALSAAALLGLSLTACGSGGGSSAPTSASKADFCAAYGSGDQAFANVGDSDYSGAADAMHTMADKLKKVGTPSDIPADARAGFEALVDAAGKASADKLESGAKAIQSAAANGDSGSESDLIGKMFGLSSDQMTKVTTFTTWAKTYC
ncbi:hypothetical protein [Nocardioides maradonensis]